MSLEINSWTFSFQKNAFIGDLPGIAPSGRRICIVLHLLDEKKFSPNSAPFRREFRDLLRKLSRLAYSLFKHRISFRRRVFAARRH